MLLTCQEVCSIIETSGKANVSVLKFAGLYLRFGSTAPALHVSSDDVPEPRLPGPSPWSIARVDPVISTPVAAITDKDLKNLAEKTLLKNELEMREQQLELMRIENPLLYEELLQANGELIDDDESIDDDDTESGN